MVLWSFLLRSEIAALVSKGPILFGEKNMAKLKFDGVIEAVRYTPDGKIGVVRAYERRGSTFSDRVLIQREMLVERLKKGQKFFTGQRKEFWASTFEVGKSVRLVGNKDQEFVTTDDTQTNRDLLEEVPVF